MRVGLTASACVAALLASAAVAAPAQQPAAAPATTAAASAAAPAAVATRITGTLLGSDGRPMRAADVRLLRPGGDSVTLAAGHVDSTGHFAVATTARGTVVAAFTGVDHTARYEYLLLGDGAPVGVDVRLARPRIPARFDSVGVRGEGWAAAPGSLAWRDTTPTSVRYARLLRTFDDENVADHRRANADPAGGAPLLRAAVARWEGRLAADPDPALRQLVILRLLWLAGTDSVLPAARRAALVDMLDFTHPAWGGRTFLDPGFLYGDAPGRVAGLPDSALGRNETWRDSAVFARRRAAVAWVIATYKLPHLRANSDVAVVRVGRPMPPARFTALDGTTRYGPEFFASRRLTLIEFWATWCGPCVGALPGIEQNLAAYRGRGFDVLSVSLDTTPDIVRRFRATKRPMPWPQAWAEGGFTNETVRRWEVAFVPRAVLVDDKGTVVAVVAVDAAIRGDKLGATLARLLGPPGR